MTNTDTATDPRANIGRTGSMLVTWGNAARPSELTVTVSITDARTAYGSAQYQITPVAGSGSAWVMAHRVTLLEQG